MSKKKKSKGVVFDSTSRYGVGVYEDPKADQDLMLQDFHDLQRETDSMRSKLKAANQRKSILAAEVRFLQKRHRCLVTANNNMNPSHELKTHVHAQNLLMQSKTPNEQVLIVNESSQRILPFVPEGKRMKHQYMAEQTVTTTHKKTSLGGKQAVKRISTPVSNSYQKERRPSRREVAAPNLTDKNGKERTLCENEYAASRNSLPAFDLNEASFPTFDLNETSTGMRIS